MRGRVLAKVAWSCGAGACTADVGVLSVNTTHEPWKWEARGATCGGCVYFTKKLYFFF